jgi:oligoribonuclease (3'-5' exoribonuclease)
MKGKDTTQSHLISSGMNQTPVILMEFKEHLLHNGYTDWMEKFHKSSNLTEILKTKITQCASSINLIVKNIQPMLVATLSKVWVCGHSLAGIAGLNPAAGMNGSLL